MKKLLIAFPILFSLHTNVFANNFQCPAPQDIKTVCLISNCNDPSSPPLSAWFAPTMSSSKSIGFGVGGSQVGSLITVLPTTVNGNSGWSCVYQSNLPSLIDWLFKKMIDE